MARPCDRCGRRLEEDTPRYVVQIQVTADVPTQLDADLSSSEVEAELARVLAQLEAMSAAEAEAGVQRRDVYLLCPGCRSAWLRDPFGGGRTGGGAVH